MSLEEVAAISAGLRADTAVLTLHQRRDRFEARMAQLPLPADTVFAPVAIGEGLGGLMVTAAGAATDRVLLWLHGGAFFLGSSASYRDYAARSSAASGISVLVPDYRLVPEHRFPAAASDALAALDWLEARGFAPDRIIIGGDSAGANLAVNVVQARLDAKRAVPAGVWLLSPYLDLTHSGGTCASRAARDPFVRIATMPATAAAYLGDVDPADPRASPLFGTVAGFPPTLIQIGSEEVLVDDAVRFADRLRGAGCEIAYQEWAGMIHVWPLFAGQIEEGRWAHAQAGAWVRATLERAKG